MSFQLAYETNQIVSRSKSDEDKIIEVIGNMAFFLPQAIAGHYGAVDKSNELVKKDPCDIVSLHAWQTWKPWQPLLVNCSPKPKLDVVGTVPRLE